MFLPTTRAVLLQLALLPVALVPLIWNSHYWPLWLAASLSATMIILADGLFILQANPAEIEFRGAETLWIGEQDQTLTFILRSLAKRKLIMDVNLYFDEKLQPVPPFQLAMPPFSALAIEIPVIPKRRGVARVESVWLRWHGPLRLTSRSARVLSKKKINIIPNINAVRRAALRYYREREYMTGLKSQRYVGDGSEFDSIRDFVPGFDIRSIDWKATARHRTLLCREYRAERNHQIVIGIDTGHLMIEPLGGVPKLDRAINAGLLLAYVSLKNGDRVSLCAFDERVHIFSEPQADIHAFARIQKIASEIEYSNSETNYTLALTELSFKLKRRSLIILFTDFTDTVTAKLMLDNVARLAKRHLVLCVILKDAALQQIAGAPPFGERGLHRALITMDLLRERERVLQQLRRIGVHCIESTPELVSSDLINRYLEIKQRELV
ncbi:MAG: DUF58 domain-containing protein [Planctomycetota bacterium]